MIAARPSSKSGTPGRQAAREPALARKGPAGFRTAGRTKVIIRPVSRKVGEAFEKAKHSPMSASNAFRGHSKTKFEMLLNTVGGKPRREKNVILKSTL
jgi:hypothetical protein